VLGVGARLAAQLRAAGERVVTVREGDTYYRIGDAEYALAPESGRAGYDALLADLAAGHDRPDRIVHLWTLTADRSARPGSSFYHHVQERGFFSLTLLAQALGDQTLEGELQLTVVTNGSQQVGDEGLLYPEKATLAGPCKVIPQEFPGIHCTRVDVELPAAAGLFTRQRAARELDALASRLLGEVSLAAGNQSVALRGGDRWLQCFERTRLEPRTAGSRLKDGGVYLITGGLGGLGLVLAEHLARTRRAKLVLVGRTPLPEREEWDAWLAAKGPEDATRKKIAMLRELERFGAEVLAVSADVANLQQMQAVLERARARFGRLDGVFHAAGILDDGLIQTKTQTAIEEVFAPKIQGALVLDQLLAGSDVGFAVLFSSTSALLGAAGQIDYVAANAFLDAFARARSAAAGPTWVAVDWGVWSDVGMGAEAAQRRVPAKATTSATAPGLEGTPAKHPLLGRRLASAERESVFAAELSPAAHWILEQHRTRAGKALLPGTGYLELARAAHLESGGAGALEIRDLYFLQPLQVDDGAARRLRVSLRPEADGAALEVASAPLGPVAASHWEQNAVGQLAACEGPAPAPLALDAIRARCGARHTPRDLHGIRTRQEREHLRFGSRWRCLREIWWGAGEALAELELPADHASELDAYGLHPALLDLATGYAMELIDGYAGSDRLFVPLSYRRVRVHAPLTARVFSHVRNAGENSASKETSSFDVSIADATGRVLVQIEGFTIKRLDDSAKFAESVAAPALRSAIDAGAASSPAERAFLRTVELGIRRHEGSEALERLLAADFGPQVIVSSIPLDALIEQVHAAAPMASTSGAKFGRPSLANEYKAPRDALETSLAELWRELLGVDRVGVEDDFFALGGHSLIAVRLFVQIRKKLGADYPISVLYEAPTIARLASLIREKHGDAEAEGAAGAKPKFRFLVPMHATEGGAKQPFFLVAGMFGNVLNLRHLADLVGKDRPFYAIQARGLYGGDQPHESFEEMAADYLEEIRRVQPRGPYLLGGFSGGGIAAYEMAQQLSAAGERVAALVFLDTPTATQPDALSARDKLLVHLQRLRGQGPVYLARWLHQRVRWEIERRRARDEETSQSFEFRSSEIEAAFYRALARYETRPYAGPVALFRPPLPVAYQLGGGRVLNAHREFIYPDNAWSRYVTGDLEVSEVPGDHDSMVLEPNVRVLAERLKACLARAGESRPAETSPR
jgi:thioesterase domain-containing protein/NAD(P)-dependent dehydrogenase (short-subunit alcohol dehydrogenase family)/acyl carrier protein